MADSEKKEAMDPQQMMSGMMEKPYFKWGLYGGIFVAVMSFLGLIPFLGCITGTIFCLLMPVLYGAVGFMGARDTVAKTGESKGDAMVYVKYAIFGALVTAAIHVIVSLVTSIISTAFSAATTTAFYSSLGDYGDFDVPMVSSVTGVLGAIVGAVLCGGPLLVIVALVFGGIGGFIAYYMDSQKSGGEKK